MEVKDVPRSILDDSVCLEELRRMEEAQSLSNTETDPMRCSEPSEREKITRNDDISPTLKDKPVIALIYSMYFSKVLGLSLSLRLGLQFG